PAPEPVAPFEVHGPLCSPKRWHQWPAPVVPACQLYVRASHRAVHSTRERLRTQRAHRLLGVQAQAPASAGAGSALSWPEHGPLPPDPRIFSIRMSWLILVASVTRCHCGLYGLPRIASRGRSARPLLFGVVGSNGRGSRSSQALSAAQSASAKSASRCVRCDSLFMSASIDCPSKTVA